MILHHIQPRTYVGSTANQICLFFVHSVCYLKSAALTCLDTNFYFLHFLLSYTPFLDSQVMTPRTTIVKIMTSLHSSRTSYFVPTSRWWLFASCVLLEWAAIRCSRDVRRHQSEPLESRLLSLRTMICRGSTYTMYNQERTMFLVSIPIQGYVKVMSPYTEHGPASGCESRLALARTRSRRRCVLFMIPSVKKAPLDTLWPVWFFFSQKHAFTSVD